MSGQISGVQAILRRESMPRALYIHCCAHRLKEGGRFLQESAPSRKPVSDVHNCEL